MDYKQETFNLNPNSKGVLEKRKRRRGFWAVFACFGGGSDMSDDAMVVPVETSGGESDQRITHGDGIVGKKERKKDKSKATNAPNKPKPTQEKATMHHVASKLKTQTGSVPVYWMLDPVQTHTRTCTSRPGSSEVVNHNRPGSRKVSEENPKENGYGPCMGVCALTFALAVLVLGGSTFGVICMCAWFCILYMLRPGTVLEQNGTNEKKLEVVDANSDEYKKLVVLRGFLERDKRKSLIEKIGDGV